VGHALIRTPWHPEVLTPAQIAADAPVARVCGSALFVRRGAWNAVGEMDEGYFMYFEEVEWQRRVAQAGWGIALTKEARVVHLVQGGEGLETAPLAYLRSAFRYHRQRGRSSAAIGRVALAGIALSLGVLAAAGVWPPLAEKAARMRGGYRRLAAVARDEARRPA
jgi:GT2 family glycosyltransferase